MLGVNLSWDTGCPCGCFSYFSLVPPVRCQVNTLCRLQSLADHLQFVSHPTIWCYWQYHKITCHGKNMFLGICFPFKEGYSILISLVSLRYCTWLYVLIFYPENHVMLFLLAEFGVHKGKECFDFKMVIFNCRILLHTGKGRVKPSLSREFMEYHFQTASS